MAKKGKATVKPAPPKRKKATFDPERSKYFVPIVFAVLFLALVVLFSDFLFSDQMLYGSDMINAGIFARSLYIDHLHEQGSILQWNPYIFGGMPYVEAFNGDIFYPFSILKFFGSIYRMIGLNLFLHIFFAGIFMYLCARQFRLSKVASLLSGVCYMFSPYLVSFVAPGHDGKIFVTALFPLVILLVERGFERRSFLDFSALGMVIGIIIVSPHPQMSYFMLWSVAFYSAFKLIVLWVREKSIGLLIKPTVLVTYAVVIGLLLSAIQFYPGYTYTTHFSPRADAKRGWEWATSWSMHEEDAFSLVIPEFSGVSTRNAETYYWGKNPFKDNSEAVGAAVFFLALLGLFFARRKEAYFFGGLAIFALLYGLASTTPVFRLFYWLIPKVQSLRAPSMIMFLFSFSAALLAGMAIQRVITGVRERRRDEVSDKRFNYLLLGYPAFMLLLAVLFSTAGQSMIDLWASLFYSDAGRTMVQQGVSKLDVAYMNLPAIQSGAWMAFLATGAVAALIWLYRSGKAGVGILVLVLAVPMVDGVRFDKRFIATYDQNRQWSETPLTKFFTDQDEKFRVLDFTSINSDLLPFHKIEVVAGYHGNQLRWYDDLIGGMGLTNIRPSSVNKYVLNLIGTKYLLLPSGQGIPPGYFGPDSVKPVFAYGQQQVFRNDNAFPRLFLVDKYRVFDDRQDIYPEIVAGSDDLRQVVYLEQKPSIEPTVVAADSLPSDSAWFAEYSADSLVIGVSVTSNKILVLTENYYDAWHAYVDGEPAELLRADGAFRAVALPAGAREVQFKFDSPRYRTGRLITLLTSIYLLAIIAVGFIRTYNRKRKEEDAR